MAEPAGMALVTGASGFVGSHLAEALVAQGRTVRCLVRRTSSLRWLPVPAVELVFGALDEPAALARALERAEAVFHLAGLTSARSPAEYARVNVEGTRRLLEAVAARAPQALVVLCSSLAAAGPSPDGRPLTELDPPRPIGPYGASKLEAERLVAASGLRHVAVRPPVVYGPRDPDVLAAFRLAARGLALRVGAADQRLSLVHVGDLARGLLDAAALGAGKGVFYLSDGAVHTWSEVVQAIGAAVGRRARAVPVPLPVAVAAAQAARALARLTGGRPLLTPERARDLAQPHWVCDDARARAELDYRSEVALGEGMADTAAWYRAKGWLRP